MHDAEIDPRRELWRQGSYEIVGDWLAPASMSVLDRLEAVSGSLAGRRLLDVATGTGTVAIEAARRGADVIGVDLTDELLDIARRRSVEAGVEVRFVLGDFDLLDAVLGEESFDAVTSSFGVMFAPDPVATLADLSRRLLDSGLLAVAAWDPEGVFMAPESMLELMPERPAMPDMGLWTTRIDDLAVAAGSRLVSRDVASLSVGFASTADAAEQLERWSGGWTQLLEMFDGLGVGADARRRFVEHLAAFARPDGAGVALDARYHTSVLSAEAPRA